VQTFPKTQASRSARLEGCGGPMVRDAAIKGCEIWVGLRSRLLTMRPGGSAKSALSHREGRLIRPAVGHAGKDNAGGLDMGLALPLVVACIDELDRAIDHLE
jgi:hypothetical protein